MPSIRSNAADTLRGPAVLVFIYMDDVSDGRVFNGLFFGRHLDYVVGTVPEGRGRVGGLGCELRSISVHGWDLWLAQLRAEQSLRKPFSPPGTTLVSHNGLPLVSHNLVAPGMR